MILHHFVLYILWFCLTGNKLLYAHGIGQTTSVKVCSDQHYIERIYTQFQSDTAYVIGCDIQTNTAAP